MAASFPFDVVVFDLDGTLADTAPDLAAALNHALVTLGREPVPAESVRHMVGQGARALLRRGLAASEGQADEAEVERGLAPFLDHYERHIADGSRPFPGVEQAMDRLGEQGVVLAICTNKIERLAHRLVHELGWEGRFAAIVGGDTADRPKPDPAPVHLAIQQAGGGRAVFVGDTRTDTAAARAAGIPCVVLSFGFHDGIPAELGGDAVIDHFDELLPALRRLG